MCIRDSVWTGPAEDQQKSNKVNMNVLVAVRESENEWAASAADPYYVKFQAVIKSAASAASPKAESRKPRPRGAPRRRPGWRMTASAAPLGLGFLDLAFGEAATAADLITARHFTESGLWHLPLCNVVQITKTDGDCMSKLERES